MAVRLRLMRLGRKGQPFYRIVAVDSRKRRDGAYIEKIGHYNPNSRPAELVLDDEKALNWLRLGAIPSDTVRSLLSRQGVMMAFALAKRGVGPEEIHDRIVTHRQAYESKLHLKEEASKPKPALKPELEAKPAPELATEVPSEGGLDPVKTEEPIISESENTPTEEPSS